MNWKKWRKRKQTTEKDKELTGVEKNRKGNEARVSEMTGKGYEQRKIEKKRKGNDMSGPDRKGNGKEANRHRYKIRVTIKGINMIDILLAAIIAYVFIAALVGFPKLADWRVRQWYKEAEERKKK